MAKIYRAITTSEQITCIVAVTSMFSDLSGCELLSVLCFTADSNRCEVRVQSARTETIFRFVKESRQTVYPTKNTQEVLKWETSDNLHAAVCFFDAVNRLLNSCFVLPEYSAMNFIIPEVSKPLSRLSWSYFLSVGRRQQIPHRFVFIFILPFPCRTAVILDRHSAWRRKGEINTNQT